MALLTTSTISTLNCNNITVEGELTCTKLAAKIKPTYMYQSMMSGTNLSLNKSIGLGFYLLKVEIYNQSPATEMEHSLVVMFPADGGATTTAYGTYFLISILPGTSSSKTGVSIHGVGATNFYNASSAANSASVLRLVAKDVNLCYLSATKGTTLTLYKIRDIIS